MSVTTICWGLVAWLGTQLPQVAPPPAPAGKTVPAPAAFQPVWTISLNSIDQPHVVAGPANFFVVSKSAPMSARSLADGHEVWTNPLHSDLAPAASDELVFVVQDDVLHALEQSSGQERWAVRTGPLAIAPVRRTDWLFIATRDGSIAGLRALDGYRVWEQALGAPASAPPAIDGNRLFTPLADGRLVSMIISTEGKVLWTTQLSSAGTEPMAADGAIFLGSADGMVYAIRQEDGKRSWPTHALIRARVAGHPLLDKSRVLMVTLDNNALALDRDSGSIAWRQQLPARPSMQIMIDSDQLLVPVNSGDVLLLPPKTGQPITSLATKFAPGHLLVPPLVTTGPPGNLQLLRLTLGPDALLTLVSFKRTAPPPAAPKAPGGG
jgi:outer membrane protein assembly factor BamB